MVREESGGGSGGTALGAVRGPVFDARRSEMRALAGSVAVAPGQTLGPTPAERDAQAATLAEQPAEHQGLLPKAERNRLQIAKSLRRSSHLPAARGPEAWTSSVGYGG